MRQRVTIAPLRQETAIAGVIVTIEDVTALHDREKQLLAALRTAGGNGRAKTDLFDSLSADSWRVRRAAVDDIARNSAPEAIAALLMAVRDNHRNLGLLNSALTVLTLCDVDTHTTLIDFLKSPDADLRIQAALALGLQQDVRAVPALMTALKDENVNVVYHAIEALGRLRAPDAAEALAAIAESGDFFLAFPALEALGNIGDSSVASRIAPLLKLDLLLEPTAHALAKIGDETTVTTLVDLLNTPGAPANTIAEALAVLHDRYENSFGEGRHIADLFRNSAGAQGIQNLIDALAANRPGDLRALLLVLGWSNSAAGMRALTLHLGSPELGQDIIEMLVAHGRAVAMLLVDHLSAEDLEVRTAAVAALGRIGDERATPALVGLLGRDPELTIPIVTALAAIGGKDAADPLFALIRSSDAAVRRAAVGALNSLAPEGMAERANVFLSADDAGVREAGVRIAGYFGYPESADSVIALCNDGDEQVRRAAVEHLPYLDDDRVPRLLVHALRQDTPGVRAAAAAAMSQIAPRDSDSALLDALRDEDPWVRYFASRSLGRHRTDSAALALQRLAASDSSQQVRIAAFQALLRIDETCAIEIADSFLSSANADLQHAAAEAALQFRAADAIPLLLKALESNHHVVRETAAAALEHPGRSEALKELRSQARSYPITSSPPRSDDVALG